MNTYIINIGPNNSVEDIELMLNAEENSGARFTELNITHFKKADTNLVTFEDLAGGQRPTKPLIFRRGKAPVSDGLEPLWKGDVMTADGLIKASAYR